MKRISNLEIILLLIIFQKQHFIGEKYKQRFFTKFLQNVANKLLNEKKICTKPKRNLNYYMNLWNLKSDLNPIWDTKTCENVWKIII
jgi:non-homologous end joining protein Ku